MLEELQSLSETNKKRVLVIATIIIMVIISGVWISYFNSILAGPANQNAAQAVSTGTATSTARVPIAITPAPAAVSPAPASGPSLWQDIKNMFGSIANIFQKPSHYTIQPQSN